MESTREEKALSSGVFFIPRLSGVRNPLIYRPWSEIAFGLKAMERLFGKGIRTFWRRVAMPPGEN